MSPHIKSWIFLSLLAISAIQCSAFPFELRHPGFRRVTSVLYRNPEPRWSPDGSSIAFTTSNDSFHPGIYIMNADGSGIRRVTAPTLDATSADWSPDGKKLVFSLTRDRISQIYTIEVSGKGLVQLTDLPYGAGCPKWSPDGQRIAICSWSGKTNDDLEIYTMREDGTDIIQLTRYPLGATKHFEWSPDGKQIVFSADQADLNGPRPGRGTGLYLIGADGNGLTEIDVGSPGVYYPSWSPNGKQLVFSYDGYIDTGESKQERIPSGFYIMNPDRTGLRQIVEEWACDSPNWSKNRDNVVFSCSTLWPDTRIFTMAMNNLWGR